MSKKCKAASQDRRLKAKRAAKASQKAKYKAFAESGKNQKSKRFRAGGRKTARSVDHPNGKCGNPGCKKCFGVNFRPFLVRGVPRGMPHWMWLRWKAEKAA